MINKLTIENAINIGADEYILTLLDKGPFEKIIKVKPFKDSFKISCEIKNDVDYLYYFKIIICVTDIENTCMITTVSEYSSKPYGHTRLPRGWRYLCPGTQYRPFQSLEKLIDDIFTRNYNYKSGNNALTIKDRYSKLCDISIFANDS
jgi:hypothetical protein